MPMHNETKSFLKANYYFDKSDASYLNVGTIISKVMKYLVKMQLNKNRNATAETNSPFFCKVSIIVPSIIRS